MESSKVHVGSIAFAFVLTYFRVGIAHFWVRVITIGLGKKNNLFVHRRNL